ncbi:DEAD/DEAH box helicase family protein [Brachyspira aalborgi]|uniref:DEAD/DEAH box helicase n=2 Tax=Brachyspira aalborgi TaxID=29522 RepID=A0A5C8FNT2_9SPIR|nr:DEAD/DEAH box helicase family protein [Brachyspira aalborgi]TXJ51262.1 DEAD/DEAH box helicase [Brachyspira aalborgi]
MIFEKQDYQQDCINNIINLLKDFDFKKHDANNLKEVFNNFLKDKVSAFGLSDKLNIDILMETGTGKTFTYLNLIFEINKIYKQNKFIIFVPRKAILESVKQNIKLTKDYFYNQYKKHLKTYVYSDIKSLSAIVNHYIKNKEELSVLILTNSSIDKSANILNRNSESLFNTQSIFENIAELKPISIIDEPHLLKGEAFSKYFNKIKTLYFRFGATFPKDSDFSLSNVAYCLDSISAFRNYLVKQIRVHTIGRDNQSPFLLSTNTKIKQAIFSYFNSGIEKQTKIYIGEDLGKLDLRFKGISLNKISQDKVYLSNGEIIEKQKTYKLENNEITNLLNKAIDLHFEKEEKLFKDNIKALSLFFIPNIEDFRGEKPFIKEEFERLYKQKRAKILKQDLSKEYRDYLEKDFDKDFNLKVHEGYFSGDIKNKEDREADGVKMILEEKEKLLSFDYPLRFIFSVWALQEGWDNPNIFTLTKIASSSSDTSRHQQVGRGLRICVNNEGKRINHKYLNYNDNEFFDINYLDMLISGEERGFIEGLQREIIEASFTLGGDILDRDSLIKLGLNQREVDRFTIALEDLGLIEFDEDNDNYKIVSSIYDGIAENETIKNLLKDKFYRILEAFKEPTNKHSQIINSNKKEEKIKIKKNLAKEFKELWQTINKRAILTYNNINKDILLKEITKRFNNEKIEKEKIIYEKKVYDTKHNKIITEEVKSFAIKDYSKILKIEDLILDFSNDEGIPIKFLIEIYNNLNKENFINSPKKAFETLKYIIKEELHKNLLLSVSYDFCENSFSNSSFINGYDILYNKDGTPKEDIEKFKLGRYTTKDKKPSENYLYEKAVWDSKIEEEVILEENRLIDDKTLEVFAKLPKFKIPTPYKDYEPDFAYLLKNKNNQKIFFVCETKGYDKESDIPEDEMQKINYAKKFFECLNNNLKREDIKVIYRTRINKENLIEVIQKAMAI